MNRRDAIRLSLCAALLCNGSALAQTELKFGHVGEPG